MINPEIGSIDPIERALSVNIDEIAEQALEATHVSVLEPHRFSLASHREVGKRAAKLALEAAVMYAMTKVTESVLDTEPEVQASELKAKASDVVEISSRAEEIQASPNAREYIETQLANSQPINTEKLTQLIEEDRQ